MVLIKSVNLRKTYHSNENPLHAILDCNIEIREGECVVISGVKGSGKTTLLRLIGGFERPSGGGIYINGNNISLYDDDQLATLRRREVGYLFRSDNLIPELTIHENIILPILLAKCKYDEVYYRELGDILRISGILNRYPKQLTANQLYYAAFARALIAKPRIILIDEPDNNSYKEMDREVLEYLVDMVTWSNRTLIIATNDQEVINHADHVIKLRRGTVVDNKIIQKIM